MVRLDPPFPQVGLLPTAVSPQNITREPHRTTTGAFDRSNERYKVEGFLICAGGAWSLDWLCCTVGSRVLSVFLAL